MPQIIVKADKTDEREDGAVMLRERVTASDLESDHFAAQLIERLGWAVGDAHDVERDDPSEPDGPSGPEHEHHESGAGSLARRLALVGA